MMRFVEKMRRDFLFVGKMLWLLRVATVGALLLAVEASGRYDVLVYGANAAGVRPRNGPRSHPKGFSVSQSRPILGCRRGDGIERWEI
jgi:hypothetical protein